MSLPNVVTDNITDIEDAPSRRTLANRQNALKFTGPAPPPANTASP